MLSLPDHLIWPPDFSEVRVVQSLVVCVVICWPYFLSFRFSFLLAIALAVLRFTASDNPFDISSNYSPFTSWCPFDRTYNNHHWKQIRTFVAPNKCQNLDHICFSLQCICVHEPLWLTIFKHVYTLTIW